MTKNNFCVRQHYIPQFLQKGFTFDKNESQVFVIRADKIYPAHIKDNFVQNQFYSDIPKSNTEPKTLDQEITYHENQILDTLNNLKSLDINKEYQINNEYYHILWHFIFRNKKFSETVWNSMVDEYFNIYQNKLYKKSFKKWFEFNKYELLFNLLTEQGLKLEPKTLKLLNTYLNEKETINKFINQLELQLTSVKNILFKTLKNSEIRQRINSISLILLI